MDAIEPELTALAGFDVRSVDARLVPVELPETTVNGVIIKPTVEYIRVEP